MRVIAGKYRSRPLSSLRGMEIRPTSDRLRETLFNVLSAGDPAVLEASVWLDLYAGTGAVGIEAISRGAGMVYFVESATGAVELIKKNLASLGIMTGFEILKSDVMHALQNLQLRTASVDYVFLDPPYREEKEYAQILNVLSCSNLLRLGSLVIAEHSKKFEPGDGTGGLSRYRTLVQGDAALSFYRKA
jgi:16S rRNA (guanine966-N2)-methyltransferase